MIPKCLWGTKEGETDSALEELEIFLKRGGTKAGLSRMSRRLPDGQGQGCGGALVPGKSGKNRVHLGQALLWQEQGGRGGGRWQSAHEAGKVGWGHSVQSKTPYEVVSLRCLKLIVKTSLVGD